MELFVFCIFASSRVDCVSSWLGFNPSVRAFVFQRFSQRASQALQPFVEAKKVFPRELEILRKIAVLLLLTAMQTAIFTSPFNECQEKIYGHGALLGDGAVIQS